MADHDLIEFSEDYYRYCFNQLYKVTISEYNIQYSAQSLWDSYLFYPLEQSKLCEDIKNARLFGGNIKWKNRKITESTTNVCS